MSPSGARLRIGVAVTCVVTPLAGCSSAPSRPAALKCNGVKWLLPRGWNGYARLGHGGPGTYFTMLLGNFPLPVEQDGVGELAAKRMKPGDIRMLLLSYGSARGLLPADFRPLKLPPRIQTKDLFRFFEHLPPGHRLARKRFSAKGLALDVQVEFAEPRTGVADRDRPGESHSSAAADHHHEARIHVPERHAFVRRA